LIVSPPIGSPNAATAILTTMRNRLRFAGEPRRQLARFRAAILRARNRPANWFAKSLPESTSRNPTRSPAASAVGLIDTGATLALIDRSDKAHAACVKAYDNSRLPLLTTEALLAEVLYLAEFNIRDARSVWLLQRSGAIQISPIAYEDLPRIQALMAQYADRPMDFADATLVRVAARERLSLILSLDHDDFETYRLPGRKKLAILTRRTRT
jgi:uncharacterized protein